MFNSKIKKSSIFIAKDWLFVCGKLICDIPESFSFLDLKRSASAFRVLKQSSMKYIFVLSLPNCYNYFIIVN